jgi:xylan 1,4-beta-xylosidase
MANLLNRNRRFGSKGRLICFVFAIFALSFATVTTQAQNSTTPIKIQVHADHSLSAWQPIWNYFGYDEPNYTYAPNGKKLLSELVAMSPVPVYVRTHNLFTTGDGSSSLKWGSTNVYTEDASGKPVYDWKIVDRIFGTYHQLGIKPLVELGFMPQALSTKPEPYRHNFPNGSIYTGWAYPPTDYQKWADLVFHFVDHLRQRYGDAETKTWLWEVWNEPDIEYWKGTREEYFKLYDFSAEAVRKALPGARIGGPDTTGPLNDNGAAQFLSLFLQHCARDRNYATEGIGSPLDFVSFHPKGSPTIVDGHVRMGIQHQLAVIQRGFQIIGSFPEWRNTPIIFGESDPEGCAACSAQKHPENAYRNGPLYASYTAAVMNQISALAADEHVTFQGAVTWAFEFEDQPYFAGFRELATNGIDKPVLNTFRMFGLLGGQRVEVKSSGAVALDEFLKSGVRERPDVDAVATRRDREISVLIWNYHDDDLPAADSPIDLSITGIPLDASKVLVEQFRIDGNHSNSYAAWQRIGSPQKPTPEEYRLIEDAGHLEKSNSPDWKAVENGELRLNFSLPRQGLALLRITWKVGAN